MIVSKARQHLPWLGTIPLIGCWFWRKVVDSASSDSGDAESNRPDDSYIYLSREIVDRFLEADPLQQLNVPTSSLKDILRDAYQNILSPFTELEALKRSQHDTCIESARLALFQDNFDASFFRPPLDVDNLRLEIDDKVQEFELEDLMTHLLERVLQIQPDLSDCARLLTEQTRVVIEKTEDMHDILFHPDYSRHFQDRNRTRRYLKLYIQAILENILSNKKRALCLLENGLLALLLRLRKSYPEVQVDKWLSMCISALSVHRESHQHLFATGWIQILAQWLHSEDMRISLEARRALHNIVNIDRNSVLHKSLFLLHDCVEPEFDVVLIHGLRGGVLRTWRQLDAGKKEDEANYTACWPKSWLAQEFPNSRILAVNYQTFLSNWNVYCTSDAHTLKGRSEQLYDDLRQAGVGERPIVWIAHSMGGLLLKQMLTEEDTHQDEILVHNTKGIVFFSVPHRGSPMAVWSPHMQRIISPSDHVMELRKDSPELETLHSKFVDLFDRNDFDMLSFGEKRECCVLKKPFEYWTLLVEEDSANPGVGEFVLLDENHFDICKPRSRQSQSYIALRQFICDIFGYSTAEQELGKDILVSSVI